MDNRCLKQSEAAVAWLSGTDPQFKKSFNCSKWCCSFLVDNTQTASGARQSWHLQQLLALAVSSCEHMSGCYRFSWVI